MSSSREVPWNDNGRGGTRILEARFHPHGQGNEFIVIGEILCHAPYAVVNVAPDFEARVPDSLSSRAIVSNLVYLTLMSRPRVLEALLSLDNRYWSFVLVQRELDDPSP
jgi:hypothetical protein